MSNYFLPCSAFAAAAAILAVFAQVDQSGFISIDCGLSDPEGSYVDQLSGIRYTSDAGFTDGGEAVQLPLSLDNYSKDALTARSFPEGTRNCYTLRPGNGKNNKYLIRARFLYGNYDGLNRLPRFDLYIGEDYWSTISVQDPNDVDIREIIHNPTSDYVHVCLHKTGTTTPFVSAIELRPLNNTIYQTQFGSLGLERRWDFGASTGSWLRYPNDVYDRIWEPRQDIPGTTRTQDTTAVIIPNEFQVPSAVMRTAAIPTNTTIRWQTGSWIEQLYLYFHFSEVEDMRNSNNNGSRQIQIYLNGERWKEEFSPRYLQASTIWSSPAPESGVTTYDFTINSTESSTLPPIINAVEVYVVKYFNSSGTDDSNVGAMLEIKSYYGLTKNWTGDPCRPQAFIWKGLSCEYDHNSSRVISLNLSASRLTGSIAPHIANLTSIQTLDLSNNNLTGGLPDFLGELESLKVLNLAGNRFSGSIPTKLQDKSERGSLTLSIDPLMESDTGDKNNNVVLAIVLSTVAAFLVVISLIIFWVVRRRKRRAPREDINVNPDNHDGQLETKTRQFTYSEILKITNNFQKVVGKGGFGTVYYGLMDDTEVAVKMLSASSDQGYKEFQSEANLLMSVHHKNLTSFLGYCNEGSHIGIVYDYMANGNLQQHLPELSWEQRLTIATDAAQGLQYLHHGCKPPILHRDIKPTNILLDRNLQAKLSDFGLSKAFANDSTTHLSINTIAGTPGYVDPESQIAFRLTERSDVYSFGIVLLEMVTGRPVIDKKNGHMHISEWVSELVEKGDIGSVVDERLNGEFDVNSAWKVVETAMACLSLPSTTRPSMYEVVSHLKECLAVEVSNFQEQPTSIAGPMSGPFVR